MKAYTKAKMNQVITLALQVKEDPTLSRENLQTVYQQFERVAEEGDVETLYIKLQTKGINYI
jgi:hypothetical protein